MELQAFVLCGQGHNLWPFSQGNLEQHHVSANGMTKALLPIGNRSMLEYVLDWCDQADFKEINVVGNSEDIDAIQRGLQNYLDLRDEQFKLVDKVLSGSTHNHHLQDPKPVKFIKSKAISTGECLQKELLERITGDFVLLPCDFITDIPPQIFIDQYRNRDSDNLAMTFYYKNFLESTDKKQAGKQFFTIYASNENTEARPVLLDIYPMADVKKSKYLQVRTHLLWNYPNTTISTKLENSFVYFCSHEICQLLAERKTGNGAINKNHEEEGVQEDSSKEQDDIMPDTTIKPNYFRKENQLVKDPINCHKSLGKIFRDLARRSWQHSKPRETVGMFILPEVGAFFRANSLHVYTEANRFILRIKAQTLATNTQTTTASASAIGADAVIGNNCTILEKSNIKLSAIGPGCKIGNRCRIAGSILLPNVTIEDEVILENVIIGPNGIIGKKSKLTNCCVEGYFNVEPKSNLKGETLTKLDFESDEDMSSNAAESSDDDGSLEEEYEDEYEYEDDGLFDH
ncbi:related to GCD1-Translation initiation factor eIF2bgamma subunit [Zygosaccharomyces bailii ISA1307]|nr:related to GCD1-Translation initiation factor eIF2bgamma subunit [Zygosaccharomyces bailii ISA1307]